MDPITTNFTSQFTSASPGKSVVTLSYADPLFPEYVSITAASSVVNPLRIKPGENYSFHFAFDLTVASVSKNLINITKLVDGSVAFVIEKKTDFIIANDDPDAVIATWDSQGVIHRKTALNFGGQVTSIGEIIYDRFKSFDEIQCNSMQQITTSSDFISVRRLCTNEGIDWIIVYKVPQWNYVGSMIIAIICALLGASIIIGTSVVMSIVFSLNIVRPFNNLIEAFEMVSNMELENLDLRNSRFAEVKSLQTHFKSMIEKIKLYRRFIPPHLLMQLDGNGNEKEEKADKSSNSFSSHHESRRDVLLSNTHGSSSLSRSNGKILSKPASSMFSLYMDKRKVTFVSIYMEGVNEMLLRVSPHDCINMLSDLFEALGQIARTNNGQIGKFENETLSVHFNATNDQANHQWKGIQMSRIILNKMNTIRDSKLAKNSIFKSHPDLLQSFKFRIAINCQSNLCGNVGSKQVMNFSILGTYQYNSEIMIGVAKQLELDVVISEEIYQQNNHQFEVRFVETKKMIQEEYYTSPSFDLSTSNSQLFKERNIYELGESNQVSEDGKLLNVFISNFVNKIRLNFHKEWMYELEAKEKKNRWKKYHEACGHYFNANYEQAIETLQEYLKECKQTDKVAENLLNHIQTLQ